MNAKLSNSAHPTGRVIEIDLLALDLNTCKRCLGTLGNIETAVGTLKKALEATGTDVRLRTVVIESEEEARRHRFVTSPTVRINGRDLVFDTLESTCDPCTDLCGCAEGTSCRVWPYRGQVYPEAPVGLVVEALLRELAGAAIPAPAPYAGVPENLRRFFAGRARRAAETGACCSEKEQEECCEADDKVACCGAEPTSCGCR